MSSFFSVTIIIIKRLQTIINPLIAPTHAGVMGYTHYYSIQAQLAPEWQDAWPKLITDTSIIIEAANIPLSGPGVDFEDYSKPPKVNFNDGIYINGIGKGAHEALVIDKNTKWSFVKTQRKPYVCCILLRARMLAPNSFGIRSDGEWDSEDEWGQARELYHNLWPGDTLICPWEEREC